MQNLVETIRNKKNPNDNKILSKYEQGLEKRSRDHTKAVRQVDNPFENIVQKRNFQTLGNSDQTVSISKARSQQMDVRKDTLLKEYHSRPKDNTFIDKRESYDPEFDRKRESQLKRQSGKTSHKNKFALEDDNDIANELSLGDRQEDETESKKRKQNIMNDIIQKSKKFKGQAAKEKANLHLLHEDLDLGFDDLAAELQINLSKTPKFEKKKSDYEQTLIELGQGAKAKPVMPKKNIHTDSESFSKKSKKSLDFNGDSLDENFVLDDQYVVDKEQDIELDQVYEDDFQAPTQQMDSENDEQDEVKEKLEIKSDAPTFATQKKFDAHFSGKCSEIRKTFGTQVTLENMKKILRFMISLDTIKDLDVILSYVMDVSHMNSLFIPIFVKILKQIHGKFETYPNLGQLYFFKILCNLFRFSGPRHEVLTPLIIHLNQILMEVPIVELKDVISGLYVCNLISFLNQDRFTPETIVWINIVLNHSLFAKIKKEDVKSKLKFDSSAESVLFAALKMTKHFAELDHPCYHEIFARINKTVQAMKYYKELRQEIVEIIGNKFVKRHPLQWFITKPVELRTFEPLIYEDGYKGRIVDSDPNRLQKRIIEKKIKREQRSSARELRRDNLVLRKAREEDSARVEQIKKENYKKAIEIIDAERHMHSQLDFAEKEKAHELKQMRKNRKGKK